MLYCCDTPKRPECSCDFCINLIGQYSISVSSDGSNWGSPVDSGTWANDHTQKYAVFTSISTRFVRLTALTESGNRGPWSSAAEINIHGEAPAVGVGGSWSAPIGFPIVPVSAVMLPNNKPKLLSLTSIPAKLPSPRTLIRIIRCSARDLRFWPTGGYSSTAAATIERQQFIALRPTPGLSGRL